jgi:hypothetical protein
VVREMPLIAGYAHCYVESNSNVPGE